MKDHGLMELNNFRIDPNTKLLYLKDADSDDRLCIPNSMHKRIMETAHDQRVHPGINHTLDFLQKSVYMANMSKLVQGYIHSCPVCSVVKPNRQLPARQLHPIKAPDISLYTLSINFMSRLPPSSTGSNCVMTITDKFTKYICILPGCDNFLAYDWAHEFYDHVYKDWGSP